MTFPVAVCAGSMLAAVRSSATERAQCKHYVEGNSPGSMGWFVLIKATVSVKL